jgi:hypothetical protein
MATHSIIAKQNEDGSYESIYCHFDGNPDGVGKMLKEHYTDPKKVDELMKLGDLSILGAEIGVQHPFYSDQCEDCKDYDEYLSKYGTMCVAYGRDRGDKYTTSIKSETLEDLLSKAGGSYLYCYREGKWVYTTVSPYWAAGATFTSGWRDVGE